jgi:hypothetical protein
MGVVGFYRSGMNLFTGIFPLEWVLYLAEIFHSQEKKWARNRAADQTSTAKKTRIKTGTQRRLVPIVVFEIRSLLVSGYGTYQPGVTSGPR